MSNTKQEQPDSNNLQWRIKIFLKMKKFGCILLVSTYVLCERLSVMHKQVCTHSSNSKICVQILQKAPFWNFRPESPPPKWKTSDLRWPKFTLEYPPKWKTSDLRWPKFTPEYPPSPMKNFRFEMTKVYSGITPPPEAQNLGDRMWRLNLYPPWIPSRFYYVDPPLISYFSLRFPSKCANHTNQHWLHGLLMKIF